MIFNPINTKSFNISGPCDPSEDYMLDPLRRLPDAFNLINDKRYFAIHAPRNFGKTTFLQLATKALNDSNACYALHCSLEAIHGLTAPEMGIPMIVNQINKYLSYFPNLSHLASQSNENINICISSALNTITKSLDKPFIIFFDDVDCLSGQVLISFLKQIREDFSRRKNFDGQFPWSIAFVGMLDIHERNTGVHDANGAQIRTDFFNIITESLTLSNFSMEEIRELYSQHTENTGQKFSNEAIERVHFWSDGQPCLVNALARQVVEKDLGKDFTVEVLPYHIDAAAETIIKVENTHTSYLLSELEEPRVSYILNAVLAGNALKQDPSLGEDIQYCIGLGLLSNHDDILAPSNNIYADAIVQALNGRLQVYFGCLSNNTYIKDAETNISGLLKEFQTFWMENSEILINWYKDYPDSAAHLILQAFIQRALNDDVFTIVEYGLNRKRVLLCIIHGECHYAIEITVKDLTTLEKSLQQISEYMNLCGSKEGWLVIFDRSPNTPWSEKLYWDVKEFQNDQKINIVGC